MTLILFLLLSNINAAILSLGISVPLHQLELHVYLTNVAYYGGVVLAVDLVRHFIARNVVNSKAASLLRLLSVSGLFCGWIFFLLVASTLLSPVYHLDSNEWFSWSCGFLTFGLCVGFCIGTLCSLATLVYRVFHVGNTS
jgi:hypothetical protein